MKTINILVGQVHKSPITHKRYDVINVDYERRIAYCVIKESDISLASTGYVSFRFLIDHCVRAPELDFDPLTLETLDKVESIPKKDIVNPIHFPDHPIHPDDIDRAFDILRNMCRGTGYDDIED